MAQTQKKRHLYFDQQEPAEEPQDAEHSTVTQSQFSRSLPTTEDDYFLEKQLKARRARESRDRESAAHAQPSPPKHPADADQPGPLWRKIIRALTGHANRNWRP